MSEFNGAGVLPAEELIALSESGGILLNGPLAPRQLQPASIDLTLGRRGWRVRASFLPSKRRTVQERLRDNLAMQEIDLTDGALLERGCVYVVELNERLTLPESVSGAANPKSSTGRLDVFVRMVADYGVAFDEAPAGYAGPLYAEISPRTFSIIARTGSSLNQLRLKRGDCVVSDDALLTLHEETPLIDAPADIDGGIGLTVQLGDPKEGIVGWRARRHAALVDVDEVGKLAAEDYFEPIAAPKSGFIILDPDEFYILASREARI